MSTTTMNLPCVRFVKRVNNGALGSKYSYIAMMAENAKALESAAWRESSVPTQNVTMPVNKVTETDATYDDTGVMISPPSFSAFMYDGFDCYQQGGDARKEDGIMCGYAGCVAYRFKIPDSAASVALSSVSLAIQRDRYCRAGVRVALALSNSSAPSNDWSVVRGEGSGAIVSPSTSSTSLGVASWGFLSQSNVQNLVSGRAADSKITFNASGDGGFSGLAETGMKYLWVYLTLEDYQSYWTMYNAKEARYYSIEGSAILVASRATFTFDGDVTTDSGGNVTAEWACVGILSQTDDESAFGNFCKCGFRSILPITTRQQALTHPIDIDIGKYDAKPFMASSDWESGGYFPISDCDIIGGVQNPNSSTSRGVSCKIHNKYVADAADAADALEAGKLQAFTVVEFNYMPFRVPPRLINYSGTSVKGCDSTFEYRKISFYVTPHTSGNYLFHHVPGMDVRLLLWRSRSPSFDGPWGEAALAALASNPNFFTGKERHISGSAIGNGYLSVTSSGEIDQVTNLTSGHVDLTGVYNEGSSQETQTHEIQSGSVTITGIGETVRQVDITKGVTVSAEADLIQEVDCFKDLKGQESTYEQQMTMQVDLDSPVKANDVLIIVPHLRMSHVNFTIDTQHLDQAQDYEWSMANFDLKFLD